MVKNEPILIKFIRKLYYHFAAFPNWLPMRSENDPDEPAMLSQGPSGLMDVRDLGTYSVAAFPFLRPSNQSGTLGQFGPYTVLRYLGSGSAGFVFLVDDPELHRPVALKVLRPEWAADQDHRQRFLREGQAAAAIHSDHTVPIYSVGEVEGLPYLAMMYLTGETLQSRLERSGPLSVPTALAIARQVAAGLADAHAQGVIHRDIKPANLWLESDRNRTPDSVRRIRILDFGLARTLGAPPISTAIVGTPQFMSPEQAEGSLLDPRCDLFSFGGVLYTMLTGRTPFRGPDIQAILSAVAFVTPQPPRALDPAIPEPVSAFTMALLAKDRNERPPTADGVVACLDELMQAMPACPPLSKENASFLAHSSVRCCHDPTVPMKLEYPETPAGPRRSGIKRFAMIAMIMTLILGVFWLGAWAGRQKGIAVATPIPVEPIRVGVLHSRMGATAAGEEPILDATLLAIDEINNQGGVLGRPVQPICADATSDPIICVREAEQLITEKRVSALFGGFTSSARRMMRTMIERHNGLLFYPMPHEGLEHSPRIVFTGASANQQLLPAVEFLSAHLNVKRFFLVGSDSVDARAAGAILQDRGHLVGQVFLTPGKNDWQQQFAAISAAKPETLLLCLPEGGSLQFYRGWRREETQQGWNRLPILTCRAMEHDLHRLEPELIRGDFLAGSYFEALNTPASREFAEKYRRKHGESRITTDSMAAAYTAVYLWKSAAEKAGSVEPAAVVGKLPNSTFQGPQGGVLTDAEVLQLLWLPSRVARFNHLGKAEIISPPGSPIRPVPFPDSRTPEQWDRFLHELQDNWQGQWRAPDSKP